MRFTLIEWEILAAATEDHYGLWEIITVARGVEPDMSEGPLLNLSRSVLTQLLRRGLITIYWMKHHAGWEEEVPASDSEALLYDDSNWLPPNIDIDQAYVAVGATELGARDWQKSPHPSGANGSGQKVPPS